MSYIVSAIQTENVTLDQLSLSTLFHFIILTLWVKSAYTVSAVTVKQVALPNAKQTASCEVQMIEKMAAAEPPEVKPTEKPEEKPPAKKPKKEKAEKKGKDKNAGKEGRNKYLRYELIFN